MAFYKVVRTPPKTGSQLGEKIEITSKILKMRKLSYLHGGGYFEYIAPAAEIVDISAEKGFALSVNDPDTEWGGDDNDEFDN